MPVTVFEGCDWLFPLFFVLGFVILGDVRLFILIDIRLFLIKVGSSLVPFINKFPRNTELYRLMTTKFGEV